MKKTKLFWVGPRRSDIEGIEALFSGAITLSGKESSGEFFCKSLIKKTGRRLNPNDSENYSLIQNFYIEELQKIIKRDSSAVFLWYGLLADNLPNCILSRSIYNNPISITRLLSDKLKMRALFSQDLDTLPSFLRFGYECEYSKLKNFFKSKNSFVIQEITGSGGHSTFVARKQKDLDIKLELDYVYLVSSFFEKAISLNSHIIIAEKQLLILPPSVQIVQELNNRLYYCGCDFSAIKSFNSHITNKILEYNLLIGNKLKNLGYRGVVGIDYLLDGDNLYFVEINPRFQASTAALNKFNIENALPTVQELHLLAFKGPFLPEIEYLSTPNWNLYSPIITDPNKIYFYNDEDMHIMKTPDPRESSFNKNTLKFKFILDGAIKENIFDKGSSAWRLLINKQIVGFDLDGKLSLLDVISQLSENRMHFPANIKENNKMYIAFLKFSLFAYGARIDNNALEKILSNREYLTIRDGIAGGLEIVMFNDVYINVPIKETFAFLSPFSIDWDMKKGFFLKYKDEFIEKIVITPLPSFVGKVTKANNKMEIIGQLFTDRLGISPFMECKYSKANELSCKFCEIGATSKGLKKTDIVEIEELLTYCLTNKDINLKHILLSGGTPTNLEWNYFVKIIKTIKKNTNIKIYIMIEPPLEISKIKLLYDEGVDEIGFNIEIFDRNIAKRIMPGKGQIPLRQYFKAMDHAVSLWGKDGQVRSILIVGLEPIDSTFKGVKCLAKRHVMPILSPFRPCPKTDLADHLPPTPKLMFEIWKKAQAICQQNNLTLGPLCKCCQNNTITLPFNDKYCYY